MKRQASKRCRSSIGLRAILFACVCACLAHTNTAFGDDRDSAKGDGVITSRIIHTFDFNEPNNFDTVPRYWVRFPDASMGDPSFPRYTEGGFDKEVGHLDSPSFYLESKGQSVGYRYIGPETRIRPGTFRVRGWIKTDRLRYGKAAISAYFIDWNGRYIGDSQQYSRLVGGPSDAGDWQKVEIELNDVPVGAQFIGVTCWLVQQDVWRDGEEPHRHIDHMDIFGGAWFDDIEIIEEPFAELRLSHSGNVVPAAELVEVFATVADDVVDGLSANLLVTDDSGNVYAEQSIPVRGFEERQATTVKLPDLHPGIYHAKLSVQSGAEYVLERSLRFAQLGKPHHPPRQVARRMGITMTSLPTNNVEDAFALFDALDVGIVKIPLWGGNDAAAADESNLDALPQAMSLLFRLQVEVVGLFGGLPGELAQSRFEHNLTLLDVLSDDPRGWRKYLDDIVAPHANVFRSWQLGMDGDLSMVDDPRYGTAISALRDGISQMITAPDLTAVQSASVLPGETQLDAENVSVYLPSDVAPEHVVEHLRAHIDMGRPTNNYDLVWASVDSGAHLREEAVGMWALRILEARWAGVDAVFADQPWTTRLTPNGIVSEPTLAYLAFRTIADVVGDKIPSKRLALDFSAKALTFVRGGESVWVIWDPKAPSEGRRLTIQLGSATEIVDLLGRQIPLQIGKDGRHELVVTKSPIFVVGSHRWLPAFWAGVKLSPSQADFALDAREHTLTIRNPHNVAMSGNVELKVPTGWTISPSRFSFTAYPNEQKDFLVSIRHPSNEPSGIKQLFAEISMGSPQQYFLKIPLAIDLDLHDVDVWGYAVIDGDRLVVRHGMTSRASETLSFRSFATYPGRSRQYRVIYELLPGQSLATEYTFSDIERFAGKSIRLGLREVNGPRIHNLEIVAP